MPEFTEIELTDEQLSNFSGGYAPQFHQEHNEEHNRQDNRWYHHKHWHPGHYEWHHYHKVWISGGWW